MRVITVRNSIDNQSGQVWHSPLRRAFKYSADIGSTILLPGDEYILDEAVTPDNPVTIEEIRDQKGNSAKMVLRLVDFPFAV